MSGWDTSAQQWAQWVEHDHELIAQGSPEPVDDLDGQVVAHLQRYAFPVNADATVSIDAGDETSAQLPAPQVPTPDQPEPEPEPEPTEASPPPDAAPAEVEPATEAEAAPLPPPDRLGEDDEPTLIRQDLLQTGTLSGDAAEPDTLEVSLEHPEDRPTVVVNLPSAEDIERAQAQADAEATEAAETPAEPADDGGFLPDDGLFIPALTRPNEVSPEPEPEPPRRNRAKGGTVIAPAPAPGLAGGGGPVGPAPVAGDISTTSGEIQTPADEAAATLVHGQIGQADPVVPKKSKVVVDPSASGVFDAVYDEDEDDDGEEPHELDATDLVEEEPEEVEPEAVVEHASDPAPSAPPPAPPSRPAIDAGPPPPPVSAASVEAAVLALPAAPPMDPDWQIGAFGEQYPALLPVERLAAARAEADFVMHCLGLPAGARVVDLGCGDGAHAIAFAGRGMAVTGVDLSAVQLQRASASAAANNVNVRWESGDIREAAPDTGYDAAVCLGGTLGMFGDEQDRAILAHMRDRLRPGGRLALQVLNRDYIVARLPARSWWQGQGCLVLDEAQSYAPTSRVHVHRTLVFETGAQYEHYVGLRVYGLTELVQMCAQVGLRVLEYSGSRHTRSCFYGATSAEIWLVAERPADAG